MPADDRITLTEEGEAMGTLHQFSAQLNRPRSVIMRCTKTQVRDAIVLDAGEGRDWLLILDADALNALTRCAAGRPTGQA